MCENIRGNDRINLTVSHQRQEVEINGEEAGKLTQSNPQYELTKDAFDKRVVIIAITLIFGVDNQHRKWSLDSVTSLTHWTYGVTNSSGQGFIYSCLDPTT